MYIFKYSAVKNYFWVKVHVFWGGLSNWETNYSQNTSTLKMGKSQKLIFIFSPPSKNYFIDILFDHPVKARLLLVRGFALRIPYYSNELAAASTANSNKCSKLLQNYWDTAINNKYYRQLHAIASLHLFWCCCSHTNKSRVHSKLQF